MIIGYSGRSEPSAQLIADEDDDIMTVRNGKCDVNWGRAKARSKLNPDISNSTNKLKMRILFKNGDVPMPSLYSYEEAIRRTTNGEVVVGRSTQHSKGRGFWLCKTPEDVERAWQGTKKKKPATHFMEFIEAEHEVRVHIFKGKSIRISEKEFFVDGDGDRDYTTIKPTIDCKRVRQAAKKAVKALGLDFGAVDILATDEACYVLEVNAAPGLGGTMPKVYAKVFKDWYENNS